MENKEDKMPHVWKSSLQAPNPPSLRVRERRMNRMPFSEFLERYRCILGEGAVIERLRRNADLEMDAHIVNSAFVYDEAKRAALEAICRQYLDIGFEYGLPLLLSTPTWRASRERIATAGYEGLDVNGDNFRFLDGLRRSYGEYGQQVALCGLPASVSATALAIIGLANIVGSIGAGWLGQTRRMKMILVWMKGR